MRGLAEGSKLATQAGGLLLVAIAATACAQQATGGQSVRLANASTHSATAGRDATSVTFPSVTLNPHTTRITAASPCGAKSITLGKRSFKITRSGFYDFDLTARISSNASFAQEPNDQAHSLNLTWQLDGREVAGTGVTFAFSQGSKTVRLSARPGSLSTGVPLWLKPGTHVIEARGDVSPLETNAGKPVCNAYTNVYSNLHALITSAD